MRTAIRRLAGVAVVFLISATTAPAAPTARDLEKQALDYRKALKPGHVVVKVTNRGDLNARPYESIIRTFDQTFDGPKVRSIVSWKSPKWERTTRTAIAGGLFIRDWSENFAVDSWPADSEPLDNEKREAWDPRMLGLVPLDVGGFYMQSIDRDDQVFWYDRHGEEPTVTPDRVGSRVAWRIDCTREPHLRAALWVVPEFGHGPARIQIDITAGRLSERRSLDVDYEPARSGGVWYPRKVVYRTTTNDEIRFEQIAEVEAADFGVAIPPQTFSYKGLDLPPGRKVLLKPENRAMIWDGRKLKQEVGRNPGRPLEARGPRSRWYLWAGAIATAIGSAALVFRLIYPSSRSWGGAPADPRPGPPRG